MVTASCVLSERSKKKLENSLVI